MGGGAKPGGSAGYGEWLGHVAFALLILIPASGILLRAGAPAGILSGSALLLLVCALLIPAGLAYSPGFAAFSRLEKPMPLALAATLPLAMLMPAALALSADMPFWTVAAGLAGMFAGLALSLLIRFYSAARFGTDDLAELLEAGSESRAAAQALRLLLALPLIALLCAQSAAFAGLAEAYFGLLFGPAVVLCLGLAVLLVLFTGIRAIALGVATLLIALMGILALRFMDPEGAGGLALAADLAAAAQLALPFIVLDLEPTTMLPLLAEGAILTCGIALLPLFGRSAPVRYSGRMILSGAWAALLSLMLIAAAGWALVPSLHQAAAPMAYNGVTGMSSHLALLVVLLALVLSASVPLLALALMAASQLRPDGMGYLPARRLALARISILGAAMLCGWLTLRFDAHLVDTARLVLATAASALPLASSMLSWRVHPWVALLSLALGTLAATALYLVQMEGFPTSSLTPAVAAACTGMAVNAATLAGGWLALKFLNRKEADR